MTPADITELQLAGVLTARQADVIRLRERGFSQNQIAVGLHISRSTVRYLEREARQKIARHRLAQIQINVTIDGQPADFTLEPKEPAA